MSYPGDPRWQQPQGQWPQRQPPVPYQQPYPQQWQQPPAPRVTVTRVPLSAGSHLLHLILTCVTGGLWLPVWIIMALRGRKVTTSSR